MGDDCLIVLTRTARAALDGLLLGWDLGSAQVLEEVQGRSPLLPNVPRTCQDCIACRTASHGTAKSLLPTLTGSSQYPIFDQVIVSVVEDGPRLLQDVGCYLACIRAGN